MDLKKAFDLVKLSDVINILVEKRVHKNYYRRFDRVLGSTYSEFLDA